MSEREINVLVVDDSPAMRLLLVHILESDPQILVAGAVANGRAALEFVMRSKPAVVVMDIHMPELDGFEATRLIMETQPVPIVICSATTDPQDVALTFRLMEAGAVACLQKPVTPGHADFDRLVAALLQTVKAMSEVKVVRRWRKPPLDSASERPPTPRAAAARTAVVGIGASTGGPPVLQAIFAGLPKDFPLPILVVQHIAPGFLPGLVEWLNQTTALQVHIAALGVDPLPGHVYMAPDDFHLGIGAGGLILLTRGAPENGLRPAVAHLFRTLAEVCGRAAAGVLLTGMGKDGAAELKLMKDRGAVTIAQDGKTSVVHGMPGEAIALGGAIHVLPANEIADALLSLAGGRNGKRES